ncbi:hypothetical protein N7486_008699 [Penicillium sp. IBT 16267x]|nr:hypothetical protein N7486_008699 [Penicillium sp. IBT 16267x]
MVYRAQIDLSRLRDAFRQLLTSWPVLQTRVNFLRTSLVPVPNTEDSLPFYSRVINNRLSDYLSPELLETGELSPSQWRALHGLLKHEKSLSSWLLPPACAANIVQLQDVCLVEFVVQHVLCDSNESCNEESSVKISRHDLLLAILYKANMDAFPDESKVPFGFTQNIQHDLDTEPTMHNTFWIVTVPRPTWERENMNTPQQLVKLASYIREVVTTARSQDFLESMLQYSKDIGHKPIHLRNPDPRISELLVSSSSHLPAYFFTVPTKDGQHVMPEYVDAALDLSETGISFGLTFHDCIVTIKDKEGTGFLLFASLQDRLWQEIGRMRNEASYWSGGKRGQPSEL